jgi:hypothetical protein
MCWPEFVLGLGCGATLSFAVILLFLLQTRR